MPQTVDQYVADASENFRPIVERVRQLVIDELPHSEEGIHWSRPTYKVNDKHVCFIAASKSHVTLGFTNGRSLSDPEDLLEGEGKQMAHVKLRSVEDIEDSRLRSWLREANDLAH